jgi:pilus assembly protein FimV
MRFKLVSVAAALLAAMPGISLALGLGDIQLRSSLNAPLNAEIELIDADSELGSLQVQLASRDSFSRYGLDYPAWFSGIQARVVRLQDGRNVVQLTSTAVITEPFATLLVEASWARGRTQREYTVLFDPPTFAPQQAPAAPIAAPTGGDRSAEIARQPAQQPAPAAPAPAPAAAQTPAPASGDYTVPRGDSLSAIAQRQYGAEQRDQAMIAIFRSNPQAFGSNINQLRAGSVLRLPEGPAVAAVDRAEARGEVRRQWAEWTSRAAAAPAAEPSPRLVLVPPGGHRPCAAAGRTAQARTRHAAACSDSACSCPRRRAGWFRWRCLGRGGDRASRRGSRTRCRTQAACQRTQACGEADPGCIALAGRSPR